MNNVHVYVICSKCGEEYDASFWSFCPKCSTNQSVDIRCPTEQITDTQCKPVIGKNHSY